MKDGAMIRVEQRAVVARSGDRPQQLREWPQLNYASSSTLPNSVSFRVFRGQSLLSRSIEQPKTFTHANGHGDE
jgi:hypothetical protein